MSLRWADETFATRSGRCLVKTRLDGQYHVGHLDPGRYWDGDMRRPQWLWVVERKTNKLGRWSEDESRRLLGGRCGGSRLESLNRWQRLVRGEKRRERRNEIGQDEILRKRQRMGRESKEGAVGQM